MSGAWHTALVHPIVLVRERGRRLGRIVSVSKGEDEPEGIFAIKIEAEEALLTDEPHRSVQGERSGVVVFGFKSDLETRMLVNIIRAEQIEMAWAWERIGGDGQRTMDDKGVQRRTTASAEEVCDNWRMHTPLRHH